jgi:hypothetical protein
MAIPLTILIPALTTMISVGASGTYGLLKSIYDYDNHKITLKIRSLGIEQKIRLVETMLEKISENNMFKLDQNEYFNQNTSNHSNHSNHREQCHTSGCTKFMSKSQNTCDNKFNKYDIHNNNHHYSDNLCDNTDVFAMTKHKAATQPNISYHSHSHSHSLARSQFLAHDDNPHITFKNKLTVNDNIHHGSEIIVDIDDYPINTHIERDVNSDANIVDGQTIDHLQPKHIKKFKRGTTEITKKSNSVNLIHVDYSNNIRDPLELCLNFLHDIIGDIYNDLDEINKKIIKFNKKYFKRIRKLKIDNQLEKLTIDSYLLNTRFNDLLDILQIMKLRDIK